MMEAIFEYIDRIFDIVRPRQLLYMAIGTRIACPRRCCCSPSERASEYELRALPRLTTPLCHAAPQTALRRVPR